MQQVGISNYFMRKMHGQTTLKFLQYLGANQTMTAFFLSFSNDNKLMEL